ncbi:MAG: C10 family peptidase [Bacteroidales bacterium]
MRRLFYLVIIICLYINAEAKSVRIDDAKDYADKFIALKSNKAIKSSKISIFQKGDVAYTYLVNYSPEGWAIVAADDRVQAILAYSTTGVFDTVGIKKVPFYFWFENYEKQIKDVVEKNVKLGVHSSWNLNTYSQKSVQAIEPLIKVTWNQGAGWNDYCPADSRGPGGHVYAGCVAVAMAQSMSVYKYPSVGYGERQYTHSEYGNIYVNFSNAEYQWDLMTNSGVSSAVALLLYHLGVSVSMNYGYDGSGAYSTAVPGALSTYFDYSSGAKHVSKDDFDELVWQNMLIEELSNGRPIYYSGDNGESGHAFNIDGVNEQYIFHFNWGWSGSYNGYYSLNSLTPGSSDFSLDQAAVIGITPRDHNPYDITLSNNSVKENLPANTVVGKLVASDDTPDDTHTFEVIAPDDIFGNPGSVPFTVINDNLVTTEELHYSTVMMYEIIIKTTDKDGNTFEKTFMIEVKKNPVNDIVSDETSNFNLIYENSTLRFFINNDSDGRFVVKFYDILGKQVLSNSFDKNKGEYNNAIAVPNDLHGMFVVLFDFENTRIARKVILN